MPPADLAPEQRAVFEAIETSQEHIFVTGRAGTGKSTLLEYLSWNTSKQLAVCAPTGVAALGVGGQTIHSLFQFPIGVIADDELRLPADLRKLLNAIETLVIDEISMVNADLLDAIDRSLRQARQREKEAFGGVQLVLFGDPYQLPPVPAQDPDERAYFKDNYRSLWFFDARVWQETSLVIYELSTVHRQSDQEFTTLLDAIRVGTVTDEQIDHINKMGIREAPKENIITLASTNATVAQINSESLNLLSSKSHRWEARIDGDFRSRAYPADLELELKTGAQVMFLRNDTTGENRWVNGTLGTVVKIADKITVDVDGKQHEIGPTAWERYRYSYSPATKKLSKEVAAVFTQIPLRLAWAVTIHKSQGASYSRAVIDLGKYIYTAGQSYVAFSRLTQLEGLHLRRQLRASDIRVDEDVRRFMEQVSPIPAAKA